MEQKLSVQILTYLCNLIMTSPYRTMRELTIFFKQFDVPDVYGNPSRTNYTEQQLIELNNQGKLISVIEQAVDPRNFFASEIDIEEIIAETNRFLALDFTHKSKDWLQSKASGKSPSFWSTDKEHHFWLYRSKTRYRSS